MSRTGLRAACAIMAGLAVPACASAAAGQPAPRVARAAASAMTAPWAAPAPSRPATSATPASLPSAGRASAPASPAAASPARTSQPAPAATASGSAYPVVSPPAGTPWTWPPGYPPACDTAQPAPQPGVFIQALLIEHPDSTPWNGAEGNGDCLWYAMGDVDLTAKTVQLLMKDTKTGTQKAFTGHLGDVISLGRFTIKVDPPNSAYGDAVVFEADIYWS